MPTTFLTDPTLRDALAEAGIASAGALLALGGGTDHRGEVKLAVAGTPGHFFLKAYHYPGWRKARGLLGRGTLWGVAPEVQEFQALAWLARRGLPVVAPVAACGVRERGRLVAHALLTAWVPRAADLATCAADPGHPAVAGRDAVYALAELLGRTLARMHLHGFAHRDCHARNILVRLERGRPRIWLLDCRRGGPARRRAEQLRDLACLRVDLRTGPDSRFTASAWTHLLQSYLGRTDATGAFDARLEPLAEREVRRQARRAARRAARAAGS